MALAGPLGLSPRMARAAVSDAGVAARLKAGWQNPPRTYRPHTRWWWPGNAVTREGITAQLTGMKSQGMGGVEIMSAWSWYERGNIPYLSEPWNEMVRHAVERAADLDLEVALTFGAGWSFGGFWVPPEDRSKVLAPAWVDLEGSGTFDDVLPTYRPPRAVPDQLTGVEYGSSTGDWSGPHEGRVVGVVAARMDGADGLDGATLVDLTDRVVGNRLRWTHPEGRWRLMAFRLTYTRQENQAQNDPQRHWVVDHMNKGAVQRYADFLIGRFKRAFGPHFGKTIDSFFCDSFEIIVPPNTLLWSDDTLQRFTTFAGYDLRPFLPAIWFDIGEKTAAVRYDVGRFLHVLGRDTLFRTFIDASAAQGVAARIQPHYRFTTELVEAAGITPRPETEVTTSRFDPLADPHKATVAGTHFYGDGRGFVSAEAYTFIHQERFLTTPEEIKIATDAFLRDGITQFYNHGYVYSPESEVHPTRDIPWANRISHVNTWWRHYHHLTSYVSRACFMLRQGRFVGDVLLYSPQASVWSRRALFENSRRVMPYGTLAKVLVSNGYDFDPINDDVLTSRTRFEGGLARIRDLAFRFLVLPRVSHIPIETLQAVKAFVTAGGVVVALHELPSHDVGRRALAGGDERVRRLVAELFGKDGRGRSFAKGGRTYFVPEYEIRTDQGRPSYDVGFSPMGKVWEPTAALSKGEQRLVDILKSHLAPDFLVADERPSDGLTFTHRRDGDVDVYFVTNLQPRPVDTAVTFRITGKRAQRWDALTGGVEKPLAFRSKANGVEVPVRLGPWESTFLVFRPDDGQVHVRDTNLAELRAVTATEVQGVTETVGPVHATVRVGGKPRTLRATVADIPPPMTLDTPWNVVLEGPRFRRVTLTMKKAGPWTEDPSARFFSGTGTYETIFELPAGYLRDDLELSLDLGRFADVVEVELNGKAAGVAWTQTQRLELTAHCRPGRNTLRIAVTNTPHNAVAGMKEAPPVPKELSAHYGGEAKPTATAPHSRHERVDAAWSLERKTGSVPAGLMGPVRIVARKRVTLAV